MNWVGSVQLIVKFGKKNSALVSSYSFIPKSVTRLGDLFDFGQVFKAIGNNKFAQISHILFHFPSEIIFGQL